MHERNINNGLAKVLQRSMSFFYIGIVFFWVFVFLNEVNCQVPDAVFTYGRSRIYEEGSQKQHPSTLPHSSTPSTYVVLVSLPPEIDNGPAVYIVNSTENSAGTFYIRLLLPCSKKNPQSTLNYADWMAVRTGAYSISSSKYILCGIDTTDSSNAIRVSLTDPRNSTKSLFPSLPVVLAQVQNVPLNQDADALQNIQLVHYEEKEIQLKIPGVQDKYKGLRIGYFIITPGILTGADSNSVLEAVTLQPTSNSVTYDVAPSKHIDPQCGPMKTYASLQVNSQIPELLAPVLSMNSSSTASIGAYQSNCSTKLHTRFTEAAVHVLLQYDARACSYKSLDEFGLQIIQKMTAPTAPIPAENSLTIVWVSVGSICSVVALCVLLYFLCFRQSSASRIPDPHTQWGGPGYPSTQRPFAPPSIYPVQQSVF